MPHVTCLGESFATIGELTQLYARRVPHQLPRQFASGLRLATRRRPAMRAETNAVRPRLQQLSAAAWPSLTSASGVSLAMRAAWQKVAAARVLAPAAPQHTRSQQVSRRHRRRGLREGLTDVRAPCSHPGSTISSGATQLGRSGRSSAAAGCRRKLGGSLASAPASIVHRRACGGGTRKHGSSI